MRDTFSGEVSKTLSPFGVYRKLQDKGYKVKSNPSAGLGNSDVEPGFPDGFFVSTYGGALIETKTGTGEHRQNFAFANWRPNQRDWFKRYALPREIPYYLFLVMGDSIRHPEYPRIALLIPGEKFLDFVDVFENAPKPRVSMPYSFAKEAIFRLEWAGGGKWSIPEWHEFYKRFRLGEIPNVGSARRELRSETGEHGAE